MKTAKNRIMLVEDSQNLRYVLKDYFEMLDYSVTDFADGISASQAFNKGMFDICVLDIMMPGKDGFTLMQEIRKIDPDIPIILLTSKLNKEDKIKGFKLGCDDYVVKPFSTEELTLRIKAILDELSVQTLRIKCCTKRKRTNSEISNSTIALWS